jgi:hypothetical protein
MIEKLLARLNGLHPMSEKLTEKIMAITKITTHSKKTILLKDGDVNNQKCMVISGLVRSYYINEGKDITTRLMDEGFIITSRVSW